MSSHEKDPRGPPPAYQQDLHGSAPSGAIPVYTYPAEGTQQVMYAGQPVYPNQTGGYVTQQPGQQVTVIVAPCLQNPPPDQMIYAIFVTICCCWPIGIFAILKSLACREAINRGDSQMAIQMSNSARRLAHIALACGIMAVVVTMLIIIIYMAVLLPKVSDAFRDLD